MANSPPSAEDDVQKGKQEPTGEPDQATTIESLGLCKLCRLRYLGVRKISEYADYGQSLKEESPENAGDLEEPPAKCRKEETCVACLGLLQILTRDDKLKHITDAICNADYDSPVVTCAVSLPIALQIRAHSLEIHLKDKLLNFDKNRVVPMKEAWKWACSQRVASTISKESCSGASCDFLVNIQVKYTDDKKECAALQDIHTENFKERMKHRNKFHGQLFTRQGVEAMLNRTSKEDFVDKFDCPPLAPPEAAFYGDVECNHSAIFIAGRYNKYSRELSQTPWLVEGERRMESSVQELISRPLEEYCGSKDSKFVASGREDVDVRTLGRGRPFAVELPNPHKTFLKVAELANLQKVINERGRGLVRVRDLQLINKDELTNLKMGEEVKTKSYEALCICLEGTLDEEKLKSLADMKELELQQKTPIRVLHRRPLATRSRTVKSMSASKIDEKHFKLKLETQAGTYVKEFVHGDFGRTLPNLCTLLGAYVDILALDVEEVFLDWPKQIDDLELE